MTDRIGELRSAVADRDFMRIAYLVASGLTPEILVYLQGLKDDVMLSFAMHYAAPAIQLDSAIAPIKDSIKPGQLALMVAKTNSIYHGFHIFEEGWKKTVGEVRWMSWPPTRQDKDIVIALINDRHQSYPVSKVDPTHSQQIYADFLMKARAIIPNGEETPNFIAIQKDEPTIKGLIR